MEAGRIYARDHTQHLRVLDRTRWLATMLGGDRYGLLCQTYTVQVSLLRRDQNRKNRDSRSRNYRHFHQVTVTDPLATAADQKIQVRAYSASLSEPEIMLRVAFSLSL